MTLDEVLQTIASHSKTIFGLEIPLDRITVYITPSHLHNYQAVKSAVLERTWATADEQALFDQEYFLQEITSVNGRHSLRLDSNGLIGHNIELIINPPTQYAGNDACHLALTLAHEIGHVLQETYQPLSWWQRRKQKKFAKDMGDIDEAYRHLREILTADEIKTRITRIRNSNSGHERVLAMNATNASLQAANAQLSGLTSDMDAQIYQIIAHMPVIQSDSRMFDAETDPVWMTRLQQLHNDKLDYQAEQKREVLTLKSNQEKIAAAQAQDANRKKEISDTTQKAYRAFQSLKRTLPAYRVSNPISLLNKEGWAVYFSLRIFEEMVLDEAVAASKDANRESLRRALSDRNKDFLKQFGIARHYVACVDEMRTRKDEYGIGYQIFVEAGSDIHAMRLANMKCP